MSNGTSGTRRGGGGGGNINAQWRAVFQPIGAGAPVAPPNVQPGQPVPAISIAQLQSMNDQEFANYLNGLKSTPIDQNTYYNYNWDTQRLVANMPELNLAPQVVDQATFDSLPGETLFRTVNKNANETAIDVVGRTMTSDVTTIGEGVMGDGFYFANDKVSSQMYGMYRNNINATATMQAKLNGNARVIDSSTLRGMLSTEKVAVRRAVENMSSGGKWAGDSGLMAYALKKGYNVVTRGNGAVVNIIDRNAATWSENVIPMT